MLVFYVSGHGYGHAARVGAVIEALQCRKPDLRIAVRTQAPRMLFPAGVDYSHVEIDSAVVESKDALSIDNAASIANVRALIARAAGIVTPEVQFLRSAGATAIAADIPFLAGRIASEAGLPAIAMGNFTWDWIYGAFDAPDVLSEIRAAYALFSGAIRFPLSPAECWKVFPTSREVGLVIVRSRRPREEIRRELKLTPDRMVVLIGGRARLDPEVLDRVRSTCHDYSFLNADSPDSFSDLIRASDIIVSKIGYSTAAECILEGKRLLYPPRTGFREESILVPQARQHLTMAPMPYKDWLLGSWKRHLDAIRDAPAVFNSLPPNGADECAQALLTVIHE